MEKEGERTRDTRSKRLKNIYNNDLYGQEDFLESIEIIKGRSFKKGGPCHAEIEITDRCNANCYFCNQRKLNIGQKEMSLSNFKKILLYLHKRGLRLIRLSGGGEPTVHSSILQMLDFISHLQLKINFFNTNGILLTSEISQRLLQCKLKVLQISLNSSNPKTWAKINGCKEIYFYRVLENIRNFIHYDRYRSVRIIGSFILNEPTYKELSIMYNLCKDLDIEFQIKDLNCYTYSNHFQTRCVPIFMKDLVNLITSENINNFLFLNIPKIYTFLKIIHNTFPKSTAILPCFVPWVSVLIRANGDVYPCCALASKSHILGNIFKKKFMDIWMGSKFERLRLEYKTMILKSPEEISELEQKYFLKYFIKINFLNCPVKTIFYP